MLVTRPPGLRFIADNQVATPSTTVCTSYTALLAASNTKGAWQEAISDTAVTADVYWIEVYIGGTSAAATRRDGLLDVGADPAGGTAYAVIIPDLLAGWSPGGNTLSRKYAFPRYIPAGSAIALRGQNSTAGTLSPRVCIHLWGAPADPSAVWAGQSVTAYGITSASASNGTSVTPGNTGSYGSWTSIGSTTAADHFYFQAMVQGTLSDTDMQALAYYFRMGAGSTQIGPTFWFNASASENVTGLVPDGGAIWGNVPSGTQLQIQATCSGTAEVFDFGIWAVS